jgi:hypothetical protein
MTNAPNFPAKPNEGGKGGEGGVSAITNHDFLRAIFQKIPESAFVAICRKPGDPTEGPWICKKAADFGSRPPEETNNFFGCSSFFPDQNGVLKAQKNAFAACHVFMLDDLGTKVPFNLLGDFQLSWLVETSPGNYQGGIILSEPLTDGAEATRLLDALIRRGLCDAGASGAQSRWARLPVGINGKPKYYDQAGNPFSCRLVEWQPERRVTPKELIEGLGLDLSASGPKAPKPAKPAVDIAGEILSPERDENPVIARLKTLGLYKKPLGSGKHDITCPWVTDHTDQKDSGTAYFEPSAAFPWGGFKCMHSHGGTYRIRQLLECLDVDVTAAKNKPVIQVAEGELHRVVDAAEEVLAKGGHHYQSGGLIVSVQTDPISGDPTIVPLSVQAITRELSRAASWVRGGIGSKEQKSIDPPNRHVSILCDGQHIRHLPQLAGLARQPYFRETDGALITAAGYNLGAQRFGVFDEREFIIPEPAHDAALAALALLEELLSEFHFVQATDRAAALSAIFTAVVRPSLPHAPAFHIRAPVFGSGKTYLCELIGAFAGPGMNAKVSYPTTDEEATKAILSLLLKNPAVVEFDDMSADWVPHGVIKRMLTGEKITDRILGVSKTATVSTRTLFLGSGNNVGPVRDLLRRVLTIHLDPRNATPALLSYKRSPLARVRAERARYVSAVLTIILAWRQAGMPRSEIASIVTYDGAWTDYCRHPLIWLGHPDPASALIAQVRHDPDAEILGALLAAWHKAFGSTPTTIRKALEVAYRENSDLLEAIQEFPVMERGEINRFKLGWLLSRNTNRIVQGLELQQGSADGRKAWRVVKATTPLLPALPPSTSPVIKTDIPYGGRI